MTVRPVTRRHRGLSGRRTGALLVTAAVLATAACGSGSGADDKEAGPEADPAVTVAPVSNDFGLPPVERGAFPVRIQHTWFPAGTVVDAEPKRVVVLGMREQDTMTALGAQPLTVRNYFGAAHPWTSFPWLSEVQKSGDYEVIYNPTRDSKTGRVAETTDGPVLANGFAQASNTPERKEVFDVAAITAMNPDLIVAMFAGLVLEDYQKLSAIAPTITMVSSDSKDYYSSWQEETYVLGKIVGRAQYAQDQVTAIQQEFVDAYTEHPELKDASIALAAPGPNGTFRLMNPYAEMSRFFSSLGMDFPGRIESITRSTGVSRKMYGIELPYSSLNFLDGVDALVWIVGHDGRAAMDKLKKTSAYQNLRVVRNNKSLELGPDEAEALYYSSITSLPWALERLVPKLVAVLGDKAARDKLADEEAQRRADKEGELKIDYDPSNTPTPEPDDTANPYTDLMQGTEETTAPTDQSTGAPPASTPATPAP